jgi:hypothetical protein
MMLRVVGEVEVVIVSEWKWKETRREPSVGGQISPAISM